MKFLLISGSLRKDSFNTRLINHVAKNFLSGHDLEIANISGLPIYTDDQQPFPENVLKFKDQVRKSDIIIISTPEHNWSYSAAIKNAIDWGSRPPNDSVWEGKIGILMSASTGMLGGARAQYHLRQVLNSVGVITVTKPEIFISFAQEKFEHDKFVDEMGNKFIQDAILNAINLYKRFHSAF